MTDLSTVLEDSRSHGFLGPGPIDPHIEHARRYIAALRELVGADATERVGRALDLGSGGGVPGLVLALEIPSSVWVLLDSNQRRTVFLRQAVEALAVAERVTVWEGRAELAGRDGDLRCAHDLVVARSFGPPAVTAECAAPLLAVGGALVVSEPPGSDGGRWSPSGLAALGMELLGVAGVASGFAVIIQREPCVDAYPRRTGIPAKRPLF